MTCDVGVPRVGGELAHAVDLDDHHTAGGRWNSASVRRRWPCASTRLVCIRGLGRPQRRHSRTKSTSWVLCAPSERARNASSIHLRCRTLERPWSSRCSVRGVLKCCWQALTMIVSTSRAERAWPLASMLAAAAGTRAGSPPPRGRSGHPQLGGRQVPLPVAEHPHAVLVPAGLGGAQQGPAREPHVGGVPVGEESALDSEKCASRGRESRSHGRESRARSRKRRSVVHRGPAPGPGQRHAPP